MLTKGNTKRKRIYMRQRLNHYWNMEWLQALGSCRHHPAAISSAILSQKQHEMFPNNENCTVLPIGSMYAIYVNIYHQYTPNVSIYTIHGSCGLYKIMGSTMFLLWVSWHRTHQETIPWPRCHRGSEQFFTSLGDEWLGPIPTMEYCCPCLHYLEESQQSSFYFGLAKARVHLLHPSSSSEVYYILYIYSHPDSTSKLNQEPLSEWLAEPLFCLIPTESFKKTYQYNLGMVIKIILNHLSVM